MSKTRVDLDKLRQKVQYIRNSVRRLSEIREGGEERFLGDEILHAAATRYLQTGIEAMLDAAHHILAREGLGLPKTYRQAMELLVRTRIVPREQAAILQQLVKFRNRAVHLYDRIRAEELWSLMRDHLVDFEAFTGVLVRRYFDSGDRSRDH